MFNLTIVMFICLFLITLCADNIHYEYYRVNINTVMDLIK
jgi:hypothetical protein